MARLTDVGFGSSNHQLLPHQPRQSKTDFPCECTLVNLMIEDSVASHVTNYCGTDVNTYLRKSNMARNCCSCNTFPIRHMGLHTCAQFQRCQGKSLSVVCYPPLTHTNLKGYGRVRSQAIYLQNAGNHFEVVEDKE